MVIVNKAHPWGGVWLQGGYKSNPSHMVRMLRCAGLCVYGEMLQCRILLASTNNSLICVVIPGGGA